MGDVPNGKGTTRRLLPIERFARACQHDPVTGCVLWGRGTTSGQGGTVRYGRFWADGSNHLAHRWAGQNIHGLELEGREIIQTCGNSLCVEHLSSVEAIDSRERRFYWLGVGKGFIEPEPGPDREPPPDIPFFTPPSWFTDNRPKETNDAPF